MQKEAASPYHQTRVQEKFERSLEGRHYLLKMDAKEVKAEKKALLSEYFEQITAQSNKLNITLTKGGKLSNENISLYKKLYFASYELVTIISKNLETIPSFLKNEISIELNALKSKIDNFCLRLVLPFNQEELSSIKSRFPNAKIWLKADADFEVIRTLRDELSTVSSLTDLINTLGYLSDLHIHQLDLEHPSVCVMNLIEVLEQIKNEFINKKYEAIRMAERLPTLFNLQERVIKMLKKGDIHSKSKIDMSALNPLTSSDLGTQYYAQIFAKNQQ